MDVAGHGGGQRAEGGQAQGPILRVHCHGEQGVVQVQGGHVALQGRVADCRGLLFLEENTAKRNIEPLHKLGQRCMGHLYTQDIDAGLRGQGWVS